MNAVQNMNCFSSLQYNISSALNSAFLAQLISCAITNHYLWRDCHCQRRWHQRHRHCRQKLTSSSVPI